MALLAVTQPMRPRGAQTSDADASAALRHGDPEAFRRLVGAHQQAVLRFCRRYVGNAAAAADLCQDVFLTLWNERARYDHRGRLRGYLLGIARHRCLDHLKRHGRLVTLEHDEREAARGSDASVLARQLEASLHRLQPEFAEVVILRYLEELELAEIAELTGAPLGTVKSRLHRALHELRRSWHVD